MEDEVVLGYLGQKSNPVRASLRHPLSRPLHPLHLALQHADEDLLSDVLVRHNLLDVRQVQDHVRPQQRLAPHRVLTHPVRHLGTRHQPRIRSPRGTMGGLEI